MLLVAALPSEHGKSLVLSFVDSPAASPPAVNERVLDDAPAVGTGAGTFAAMAPIYRQKDDPPPGHYSCHRGGELRDRVGSPDAVANHPRDFGLDRYPSEVLVWCAAAIFFTRPWERAVLLRCCC